MYDFKVLMVIRSNYPYAARHWNTLSFAGRGPSQVVFDSPCPYF